MSENSLTRRSLLTGITSLAGMSAAGLLITTDNSKAFNHSTEIQTNSNVDIRLDWRETYNGRILEDTTNGKSQSSPTGPVISLANVLPGDSGTLSVRVRLKSDSDDSNSNPVTPIVAFDLTSDFTSPGLQEYIHAAIWYDTGLLDLDEFGAQNADRDPGEGLIHPDAEGTLGEISNILDEGVALDASPNTPNGSCLTADGAVTVTFGWSFPSDQPNINAVQGDSVSFDIHFFTNPCG